MKKIVVSLGLALSLILGLVGSTTTFDNGTSESASVQIYAKDPGGGV